ncbi:MAG: glycosyltransferase family 2 protein [Alphaproteobacteria bacterium]|nr:glycosyltransferase family 2 protein [Alphaproteobacteria bacterium]
MRRWPGWDGWLALCASVALAGLAAVRAVGDMVAPVALAALGTALYLVLTHASRRREREAFPAPDGLRVLVVVPTHGNAGTVGDVVRACLTHGAPVLCIDDGSKDASGEEARAAGATLLVHPQNRGKGAALETALDWAAAHGFSHIVAIDADGQHHADDLPAFFAAVKAEPHAIVAGLRDMSAAPKGAGYARANSNFWVWVETSQRIGDTQCGYRAYPVAAVRALCLVPSRYQWEVEVLVRAVWAGIPVVDLPCRVYYPPADERVSSYRKVVDTLRISWLNAHLIAERVLWPPRWFPSRRTWKGGHRGFVLGWRLYLWGLRAFGRRPVRLALVPLVVFYWVFLGAQQAGVDAYLTRRLPAVGPPARAWKRLQLLLSFATSIVDRFWVLQRGADGLVLDRSGVPGLKEKLEAHAGQGLVVISGHLGAADFAGSLLAERGRTPHLMLYGSPDDPYVTLLRDLPDPPRLIFVNDGDQHASLAALRALRAGDVVAVKGDRVVDGRAASVDFLGGRIRLPTGPFLLAALSGAPVLFVGCFQTGPDTYRFEADGPHVLSFASRASREEDLARWAQLWAGVLERWTELYPLQWYNFFDPWDQAR